MLFRRVGEPIAKPVNACALECGCSGVYGDKGRYDDCVFDVAEFSLSSFYAIASSVLDA